MRTGVFWVEGLLVVGWLTLLGQTFVGVLTEPAEQNTSEGMTLLETVDAEGAEWMSVYMEGQKIGVALSDRVATPTGWKVQERSFIRLRAFEQDKEITTAFVAETDHDNHLQNFTFYLSAPPMASDVRGRVEGGNLIVDLSTGGETHSQTFPLPEGAPEIALTFKARALQEGTRVGDSFEMPYFDPATLARQHMTVTVVEKGTATVAQEQVDTFTLEANFQGFKTRAVVTRDGKTLKEEGALGMTLLREPREQALYEGWNGRTPADLIALSVVSVKKPIKNPRKVYYLSAQLSGGGVEALIKDTYADANGEKPGKVSIYSSIPSEWQPPQLPVVEQRFARELGPTPLIQSTDVEIAAAAQSMVGDDLRADLAAHHLVDYLYKNIKKVPTMGIPSAKEVLKVGQGDCNEHTVLYTALARSLGLPTRMVAGIVYSESGYGGGGFLYHAWPEVWLGEWVPVDPTFGQFPADATHIKLVEGDLDKQLALMRVVGNLEIDVLAVE